MTLMPSEPSPSHTVTPPRVSNIYKIRYPVPTVSTLIGTDGRAELSPQAKLSSASKSSKFDGMSFFTARILISTLLTSAQTPHVHPALSVQGNDILR